MIIDDHTHLGVVPSHRDLGDKIRTKEDLVAFRTRYPELFAKRSTEEYVNNSDDLIADMDQYGIDQALVQVTVGDLSNDLVAEAVKKYPGRLHGLLRVGHDQAIKGYLDDPAPVRDRAVQEIARGVEELGLIGIGETSARAFTAEIHPERIADDLVPLMEAVDKYQLPIQFPTAWTQFRGGLRFGNPEWVDEVAGRHPSVSIILTKMGRSIDFYFDMVFTVAMRNSNVYLDIVDTSREHLGKAVKALGAHRILFGTDWSGTGRWVREPAHLFARQKKLLDDAGLSETEKEQVLWKTTAKLFGLSEQASHR